MLKKLSAIILGSALVAASSFAFADETATTPAAPGVEAQQPADQQAGQQMSDNQNLSNQEENANASADSKKETKKIQKKHLSSHHKKEKAQTV